MYDNPFPGLRPFKTEETYLFFGREGQIDEALTKLDKNRFIAILGSSGSGKSSLMYCGLIPNLYSGFIGESGSFWQSIVTRPGINPIKNLADSLTNTYHSKKESDYNLKANINAAILKSSSTGLIEVLQKYKIKENTHILVVIDQFEEIFRYKRLNKKNTVESANNYIRLFIEGIEQSDLPIYVIITMRSDYIGECSAFPDLTSYINKSQYLIPQMTREDKKNVIRGPILVFDNNISNQLETHILNALDQDEDQLPILQHTLMRTWEYWKQGNNSNSPIDIEHYEQIGELKNALSIHADEAYHSLNKTQQRICQQLFQIITEQEESGRGIRRPTDLKTILEVTGANFEDLCFVIEQFRQKNRVFLMPELPHELCLDTIIDIPHESLMRVWDRCKNWVEEELQNKKNYLILCERSIEHRLGRGDYLKPPELEILWEWYLKYKPNKKWAERYNAHFLPAIDFLLTSKEIYTNTILAEEKRQKTKIKRSVYLFIATAIVAFVLIFITIYANTLAIKAEHSAKDAQVQKVKAEKQKNIALQQKKRAEEQEKKAKASAKEAEKQKNIAIKEQIHASLEQQRAEEQEKKAKRAAREAENQRNIAIREQKHASLEQQEAEQQEQRAEEESKKATQLRHLAVAKSIAIRSTTLKDQRLKILLAQYAYILNKNYGGNDYDADIYAALYLANKALAKTSLKKKNHEGIVRALHISPNGKKFYSAGSDGTVLKWSLDTLKLIERLIKTDYAFRGMTIDKENKYLIMGTSEAGIRVFDFTKQKNHLIPEVSYHNAKRVIKDIFIKNVKQIDHESLIYLEDTLVLHYSLKKEQKDRLNFYKSKQKIERFMYDKPSGFIFLSTINGHVFLVENNNSRKLLTFSSKEIATSIAFDNQRNRLILGTNKGKIIIYDLKTNQILYTLEAHNAEIEVVYISPSGKFLASGSFDHKVNIWLNDHLNRLPLVLDDHKQWVASLLFYKDETKIIVGYGDGTLQTYPLIISVLSDNICETLKELNYTITEREWQLLAGKNIKKIEICNINN